MAPAPITEDYYMVLGVEHTATPELVTQSYRQLALKLHPDRNTKHDATEAFQLLLNAYETLKDEGKRRKYDFIYPTIIRCSPSHISTQPSAFTEAAQIATLGRSQRKRIIRWSKEKNVFDSSIFELHKDVRRLEQEIKDLDSIVAAAVAVEAHKNSWGAWLLSLIYKKVEDTEEEQERKHRERQERKIEKDFKERRLGLKNADLKKEENLLRNEQEKVDAANLVDAEKMQALQNIIRTREQRKRQEMERIERERKAWIWKQQQQRRGRERAERPSLESISARLHKEQDERMRAKRERDLRIQKQAQE
ncbi:hypothetical protein VE03_01937 [Pseudogymnoascus sp. 23342-1-I1]|nr:hypothetical protein VE03_01937 [Pseudogymnoascus sp. 23342-1-I1]